MAEKKKYIVKCWIGLEQEEQEPITLEEAKSELDQAEMMFPQNKYEIVEVEN